MTQWGHFQYFGDTAQAAAICLLLVLIMAPPLCPGRPLTQTQRQQLQRWVNPCDLQGHLLEPSDLRGAPPANTSAVLRDMEHAFRVLMSRSGTLMHKLFNEYFQDPIMYRGYKSIRLEWLKVITPDDVKNMTLEQLLPLAYRLKQQYTQALEICVIDQVSYYGDFLNEFRDLENSIVQTLCTLQLSAYQLGVDLPDGGPPGDHLSQYRGIESRFQRNVRDFITLAQLYNNLEVLQARFQELQQQS